MPLRLRLPFRASTKKKDRSNPSETVASTEQKASQLNASESKLSKSNSAPSSPPPVTRDSLWERAEKKLRGDKRSAELLQEATNILNDWGLDIQPSGENNHKKLCTFLDDQTSALKEKQWMVGDRNVPVQDQVTKVMRNILVVKDVINTAASASPPAAIACAAVTVSLMLFIQAVEQREVLLQGLDKTSSIILRIYKMDDLYLHSNETTDDFIEKFEETLTSLYCKLLEFQARALCYLEKNSLVQFSRGMLKRDPWDSLLKDMEDLENEARKFISLIEADELRSERERRETELQSAFEKHQVWQTATKQDKKLKAIFQLLYTCPYRDRKDRNSPRVAETCEWFTSHSRFRECNESSESSLLWVSADPGCGKSVLSKYLVDEVLPKPRGRTVCYFFFKDDYDDQKTATSALAGLLRQVLIAQPSLLPQSVLEKFETDGRQLINSFRDLWSILMNVSSNPQAGEIIFVIDALDECQDDDRNQLIEEVKKIHLNKDHNMKFLMTSRPYGHIRSAFQSLEKQSPTIHLNAEDEVEVQKISREIDLVIASRVREVADRKSLEPKEHAFLLEQLTSIQHRTYLWVTLTMEFIEKIPGFTKGNVRRAMSTEIPTSVNDAYSKILNQSPNHVKARKLLHIILAAKRPLLVEELSLALAVQRLHQSDDETQEEMEPVERFKVTIRDLCGLLLVIIEEKVYLLHQTVKEFLVQDASPSGSISAVHTWQHSLKPMVSSRILAEVCIWVLFADTGTSHEIFSNYSVRYWMVHLRESGSYKGERLTDLGALLCSPETTEGKRFQDALKKTGLTIPQRSPPLIVASSLGLEGVVGLLLDSEETDVDSRDPDQRSSLSWAAINGHEAVVKLLLQTGKVDIDSKDSKYQQTPLSSAAEKGHAAVVKLLLQTEKVDIDIKDSEWHRTPFFWAAQNGHEEVVKLLLQTGQVDINSKDSGQQNPLSRAAEFGHDAVVKLLLQTGQADIDSKGSSYQQTPFSKAAENGHETVVKLLLQTGQVDINSEDLYHQTPFALAVKRGHEGMVKLLLQTGKVDINSKDLYQQTPLSRAAENGDEAMVKLLLQTGQVDIDSKGSSNQQTPFSRAVGNGREAVARLLLQTGQVDINSRDEYQRTPLSWAARHGHEALVEFLLQTEHVELDTRDYEQRTPLSWAAEFGHEAVVRLLLHTEQVDIDSKDAYQRTPLSWAAENGHEGVVELLSGVSTREGMGGSPVALI